VFCGDYGCDDVALLNGSMALYHMLTMLGGAAAYAKRYGIAGEMADLAVQLVETSVLEDMADATHYMAPCTMPAREKCLKNAYSQGAQGLGLDEKGIYAVLDAVFERRKEEVFGSDAERATRQYYSPKSTA
jgi:hypothetical protein